MVSAAVSDEGKNLIAWFDRRNVYDAVYGQLYLGSGAAVGGNFQVSDTLAVVGFSRPSSAALGNNTFIFVWQDKRNNHTDIYARRIDGSGTALDNSFKVNDDQGADGSPVVAVNNSGVYLVAWSDQSHESDPAIYAQLYSAEATALGTNIKINDNTGGEFVTAPAISAYGNSNFVVAWVDNTNKDIYAQLVAGDGTLISSNFQVGPDGPSQWHGPAIATDEAGNFIVAWDDDRNQAWPLTPQEIFAQRYNSDGTPLGTDFKVSGNSDDPYEYPPKVKLFNNNIYTVWSERDRFDLGTGVDIWANVLDWDNPVISDTREVNLNPIEFTLMQNYPNPFNPNTTIKYSIPKESQVTLKVYNVLGSEVYTIINKEQSPGNYKAEFHAPSISSGVYFYKLKAGEFVETKKMVLLK